MFKKYCPSAKKLYFLPIIFLVFVALAFAARFTPVFAQAETFNFQGKIVRNDTGNEGLNVTTGSPACVILGITNDTCDFRVKYYSAATSGTLLGTEVFANREIGEYNGIFNLALGTGSFTAGSESSFRNIFLNNSSVFMEVDFAPDGSTYTETFLDGNGNRMAVRASAYAISASGASKQFQFDVLNDAGGSGYSNIAKGQVYYDGTNNVLRLYNGSDWLAVQATLGNIPTLWDVNEDETPDVIYSYTGLDVAFGGDDSSASFFYDVSAELLTLTNTTSGLSFRVNDEAGDTTPFAIDAAGRVGIGTDTPGTNQKLEVVGGRTLLKASSEAYALGLGRTDGAGSIWLGVDASSTPRLEIRNNAGDLRFVIDNTGNVRQIGADDSNTEFSLRKASVDSTHISWVFRNTSNNKDLDIRAYNGSTYKDFLKFDYDNEITSFSTGRVGIGVSDPSAWLGIKAATTSYAQLNLTSSAGTDVASPVSGDLWWNGTNLYFFDGTSTSDLLVGGGGGGGSLFTDGGATTYLTATGDNLALGGDDSSAPFFFDAGAELLTLTNTTSGVSFQVNDEAGDTTPFVIDADGNVGIGTATPGAKLDIAGASSTITNSSGDITINAASGTISLAGDSLTNVLNGTFSGDVVLNGGQLQLGNHASNPSSIGEGALVYNSTDKKLYYYKDSGWTEVGKVYSGTSGQTLRHNGSDWVASSALQNDGTNVTATGQVRVGNYAVKPAGLGAGALVYDTALSTLFVYDGTDWKAISTGQIHTATGVVQDGSYLQLTHNEDSFDVIASAWVKVGSEWKQAQDVSQTIDHDLASEFNAKFAQKKKVDTVKIAYNENNLGTGADGAATFSSDTNINTSTGVGRSCGDAVNYSVTALTSTTATLESAPTNPTCLAAGDEVLLINLRGVYGAFGNAGNYETLRIASISTNTVTFTTAKTKYYGDGTSDDSNIGLGAGNQAVMLQRVPNYTNVTITTSGTDLTPNDWTPPTGSADANTETSTTSAGEGGVLFFRATGTVSVAASTTINSNAKGYLGATQIGTGTHPGGAGGEAFCGVGGDGGTNGNGSNGSSGGGGGGSPSNGGTGYCGGGGGAVNTPGTGSSGVGGAGGGGSYAYGGGGAGGYGTGGQGGRGGSGAAAADGSTNVNGSASSGDGSLYSGGGGGTYGDPNLSDLFFGSGGGKGGDHSSQSGTSGDGGDGGGIVYIAANSISVSGSISSNGANGANVTNALYSGGGGAGSGGSVKIIGNTLTLGSSIVTASGGNGGTGGTSSGDDGGAGGVGRIAVYYGVSSSGTTSPAATSSNLQYNTYAIYVGEEIQTPGATSLDEISWSESLPTGSEIQVQTRSGSTPDSTDGTWEDWEPTSSSVSLENANTHTNWTGTNMTVADGDVTRNINYFEDEDEATSGNLTKGTVTAANGYAETTISSTDISTYQYISFWVRSSLGGNSLKVGFGESAATEQEEIITIDNINTWQKVYWDISDITGSARNAVTKLRITSTQNDAVIYFDNLKAESFLSTPAGSGITSTADDYIQYRFIFTTTDTAVTPVLSDVNIEFTNPSGTIIVDADRIRAINNADYYTSSRLNISEENLDDIKSDSVNTGFSDFTTNNGLNLGNGSDGAIIVSNDTSINVTNLIKGRYCADGGDAVNYSVTSLTSDSATLESAPSTGCLSVGDEVLIINLQGTYTSFGNVGNYETLRVSSISGNTVRFTTTKSKFYGDNAEDDTNIGLGASNQTVMLQRVPNYSDVTVTGSGTDFYPDEWVSPTGSINNGGGEGGVLFFRATGTVSIASGTTVNANARGYSGGAQIGTGLHPGGAGGEAFCGLGGDGGSDVAGSNGAAGGAGGTSGSNGGNGYCGGGGGAYAATGGIGSPSAGGSGGGGAIYGGGGGGGYGTGGQGGIPVDGGAAGNGGINLSGDGHSLYNGGGGGSYGEGNLAHLFFGSGGGRGGDNSNQTGSSTPGGDGGGVIYISTGTLTVSGTISSIGANGGSMTSNYSGGSGGGAGGSVKLLGGNLNLGPNFVTATGGSGGTGGATNGDDGGAGGVGRIAISYSFSVSGMTLPSAETASIASTSYAVFISDEIPTLGATNYNTLSWLADLNKYGDIQIQTRSGATSNATDGSWEAWKPSVNTTNTLTLLDSDTHTDWTGTNVTVAEGDVTRNVDEFEDEDEATVGNTTKMTSIPTAGFEVDTGQTIPTSLISYWKLDEGSGTRDDAVGSSDLTANGTGGVGAGTGKKTNAADLELSESDFLERADNADLSTGDIDFTVSAWVNMESKSTGTTAMTIVGKRESATVREYDVYYTGATADRFALNLYNSGGTGVCTVNANNFGSPSVGTWYFLVAWHDAAANTCNISVNNGTPDSAAESGVPSDTAANFRIGAVYTTEVNFFDGLIDEVGFWKKKLSSQEITDLYNSGNGNTYTTSIPVYSEATISAENLTAYDYLTFWVRSAQTGNIMKIGFGESTGTENEEYVHINKANTWQKVYWDISDIVYQERNAVTKLRITNSTSTANTFYIDNITADRYMRNPGGTAIASTPNNYIQYRVIMTTTNPSFRPTLYNVRLSFNTGYKIELTDENTARVYNYSGQEQELKLTVSASGGSSGGNNAWTETGGNVYRATGNVGIGDITPDTELKVVGSLCVRADADDCAGDVAGTIYANNTSLQSADLAEKYKVADKSINEGDIVSLSDEIDGEVTLADLSNADRLMGAVSTAPGLIMNDSKDDNMRPIGLVGRLPVKVITSSRSISKGDAITASPVAGFGIVAQTPGYIVGRAIEDTLTWADSTCKAVDTMEDIVWPEDKGNNEAKPCFKISVLTFPQEIRDQLTAFAINEEEDIYVGKVMAYVDVKWSQPSWMTNGLAQMARDYESGRFGAADAYWTRDEGQLISTEDVFANSFNGNRGFFDILSGGMLNIGDKNFVVDTSGNVGLAGDLTLAGRAKGKEGNFIVELGDSSGKNLFAIKNSNDETVFSVDSKGQVGGKGTYRSEWLKVEAGKSIEVKHNFGSTPSAINITRSAKSNGENFTTQGLGTEYYYEAKDKNTIKVFNKTEKAIYVKLTIQR